MEEEKQYAIGTLTFYEKEEMRVAIDGWKWQMAITKFDQYLRSECKHGDHEDKVYEIYESIRERLWEEVHDADLNF